MRKFIVASMLVFTMLSVSCGDKILVAKTVLAFVNIGIQTADQVFGTYAATERTKCLKKGIEGSPEFIACYKPTADLMAKWGLIEPKLVKSSENAATYVKAAESGTGGDYAAAVKESVCLLTEVAAIIPGEKWKKKIQMFLDLAGALRDAECWQVTVGRFQETADLIEGIARSE
jgi:hypothetical protein